MRVVYRRTRLLLMPSTYESYGRVAIEAAVSGIPTIANSTPGLEEALGSAGTFPARLAVEPWQEAIRQVLNDWDACSVRATALARSLDPTYDVARLTGALEALPKPTAKPTRRLFCSVVMAHPDRREWAEALAAELRCEIIYDRGAGLWDTARRALLAHDPQAVYHLVVQDDALLAGDALVALSGALRAAAGHPVSLYVGHSLDDYQPQIRTTFDEALRAGQSWVEADGPGWAVAVAHPVRLIRRVVEVADRYARTAPDDRRLTYAYQQMGLKCWYTVPSLADHRDGPSLVRKGAAQTGRQARKVATAPGTIDWTIPPAKASPEGRQSTWDPAARYPGQVLATFRCTNGKRVLTIPTESHRATCLRAHRLWEEIT
jgi:hypothetical protein